MASKKNIQSKKQFDAAMGLEKTGDLAGALKLYQKSATSDPLHVQAWNRQMILYRKLKPKADEAKLIKTAISAYQNASAAQHEEWLKVNKAKVESSRELAITLGLIQPNGKLINEDPILDKWQTRLYLLEYRIKNARKKVKKAVKKPEVAKTKTAVKVKKVKGRHGMMK